MTMNDSSMKKILIFSIIGLVTMLTACTHDELQEEFGKQKAATEISLQILSSKSVVTRADFPTGDADGDYNENKVFTLDYFIYDADPTTNTTKAPILTGRLAFNGIEPIDEATARENAKSISLLGTSLINADGTANTGYVYAIANLPSSISLPAQSQATYENLELIEMAADFAKLTNGVFTPQESFVMNGIKQFTPTLSGDNVVLVELSRRASKVTLDMNVIKLIEQFSINNATQQEQYEGTWLPNVAKMQVYMSYANRYGLMNGSYEERTYSDEKFFTYNRSGFQPIIDENGTYQEMNIKRDSEGHIVYDGSGNPIFEPGESFEAFDVTGSPFYSYPMTWKTSDSHAPFIKIVIPWVKYDLKDQYRHMDAETRQLVIAGLAGFPKTSEYGDRVTTDAAMTNRFGDEFYYKINIPTIIDGDDTGALQANFWYKIELDVAVLGSETDDLEVRLDGQYYAVDWSQPSDLRGDLFAGRYLTVAGSKARMEGTIPVYEAYGDSVSIPISTSHVFAVSSRDAKYNQFKSSNSSSPATLSTSAYTLTPTYDPANGSFLTLKHEFVSDVNSFSSDGSNAKDVSPITYTIKIRHSDTGGNSDWIERELIIVQYPPIYVKLLAGNNCFIDGFFQHISGTPTDFANPIKNGNTNTYRSANYGSGNSDCFTYPTTYPSGQAGNGTGEYNAVRTPYGSLGFTNESGDTDNLTLVTVSSFSSETAKTYTIQGVNYEYTIADPRVANSWTTHLIPYLTSQERGRYVSIPSVTYSNDFNNRQYYYKLEDNYYPMGCTRSGQGGNRRYTFYYLEGTTQHILYEEGTNNTYSSDNLYRYEETNDYTLIHTDWTAAQESAIRVGAGNTTISNNKYAAPIAPAFLISSRAGRPGNSSAYPTTLEQAQQRCATYQEAGYPAGRWRLPTEAEVYFVYTLQNKGILDTIFNTSGFGYIASSGRTFGADGHKYFENRIGQSMSIRCVYDYWYWGENDENVDVKKYNPQP